MLSLQLPEKCGTFDNGQTLPREACFLYFIRRLSTRGRSKPLLDHFGGERTMWGRAVRFVHHYSIPFVVCGLTFFHYSKGGSRILFTKHGATSLKTTSLTGRPHSLSSLRLFGILRIRKVHISPQVTFQWPRLLIAMSPRRARLGAARQPLVPGLKGVIPLAPFRGRCTQAGCTFMA